MLEVPVGEDDEVGVADDVDVPVPVEVAVPVAVDVSDEDVEGSAVTEGVTDEVALRLGDVETDDEAEG